MTAPSRLRAALISVVVAAGCSWVTPPLSSEEVLRQDPAFADLLTQRTAVSAEIQQLEQTLHGEQAAVLREIQARRAALRAAERAAQDQIQALEQRLEPARQLLQAKLRDTDEMLRRTAAILQSLRRTETELTRLIQQGGAAADVEQWESQRATLTRQVPTLEAQVAAGRRQRALYQAERRLLRR
ncbi:MAG: hypothetical protein A3C53_08405 [Omnitrophica WOR_2 bacterium RIFCSPHIGHO2_02_FULL_68_15]|nr:MAG: hypothetical protein A3C53_08405 [Omnitrophica WOR_2 bacterium RIFCSPHIGHO2_02_FULL_68_15]